MTSILKNIYASQDIVHRFQLENAHYPDIHLASLISERIEELAMAADDKGEKVDWGTLTISTRWDNLVDGLLVSCRVNPA